MVFYDDKNTPNIPAIITYTWAKKLRPGEAKLRRNKVTWSKLSSMPIIEKHFHEKCHRTRVSNTNPTSMTTVQCYKDDSLWVFTSRPTFSVIITDEMS